MKTSFRLGRGICLVIAAEETTEMVDTLISLLEMGVNCSQGGSRFGSGGWAMYSKRGRHLLYKFELRTRRTLSDGQWLEALLPVLQIAQRARASGGGLGAFESMMRDRTRG